MLCLVSSAINKLHARAATDLELGADAEVAEVRHVNLRDSPSFTPMCRPAPEGWLVNVLDGPFTDDLDGTVWYQVVARGQTGYMLSDYLRTLMLSPRCGGDYDRRQCQSAFWAGARAMAYCLSFPMAPLSIPPVRFRMLWRS
ncbi:MAG: hypothetical protein R2855_09825 [Thermomicrobiales bacterium]